MPLTVSLQSITDKDLENKHKKEQGIGREADVIVVMKGKCGTIRRIKN